MFNNDNSHNTMKSKNHNAYHFHFICMECIGPKKNYDLSDEQMVSMNDANIRVVVTCPRKQSN